MSRLVVLQNTAALVEHLIGAALGGGRVEAPLKFCRQVTQVPRPRTSAGS